MSYLIYVWPDNTWCTEDDVDEYLEFMSDDFIGYLADNWENHPPTYDEIIKMINRQEGVV